MTQVTIAPTAQVLQKNSEEATSLKISSTKQIEAFRDSVNAGITFEGLTVELTSDIRLNDGWTPINGFKGTFDGKNHTISNLNNKGMIQDTISDAYAYGFFGTIEGAKEIKGIVLDNVYIVTTGAKNGSSFMAKHVGSLVGLVKGITNINNITVNGYVELNAGAKGAGVIGRWEGSAPSGKPIITLSKLVNNAKVVGKNNADAVAGIVGFFNHDFYDYAIVELDECINTGNISTEGECAAGVYVCNGGTDKPKLGKRLNTTNAYYSSNSEQHIYYENTCYNTGNITAGQNACNLIGRTDVNHIDQTWIKTFEDRWYKYTFVINNDDKNNETYRPFEADDSTLVSCPVDRNLAAPMVSFECKGKTYTIERTPDGKTVTVKEETN